MYSTFTLPLTSDLENASSFSLLKLVIGLLDYFMVWLLIGKFMQNQGTEV